MKRILAFLVVFAFVLVACQSTPPKPEGEKVPSFERPTTVLHLLGSDPPTLDPALATDATSASYIVEIFSGLVTIDRDLKIVPDIAKSWDISPDGTVYTFNLRDDVVFHNGRPVTAEDFKFSIERTCDPKTKSAVADTYLGEVIGCRAKLRGQVKDVAGVAVVDQHTLRITIDAPRHYFLAKLTYPTAFVVDRDNVAQDKPGHPWTDRPVGTGPFRLEKYIQGQSLVLARNTYYYGEPKPKLERVEFSIAGGSPMVLYETGKLDEVPIGLQDIDRVTNPANPLNRELKIISELATSYIAFNVNQPPFDDPNVRRAFIMAVDRAKIVKVVLQGAVEEAKGILPPGMPGYDPNVQGIPYDPAEAKRLLAESKYKGKLPPVVITVSGSGGAPPRAVDAMLEMWRNNLGVDVLLQQVEYSVFLVDVSRNPNPYQMFSLGWIADYPDPQDFLEILFASRSLDNKTGYNNPDVDRLLEQAARESDPLKRTDLYRQVERMIIADVVWLPTAHSKLYVLTKPYVKGLVHPPLVVERLKYVSIEP